MYLIGNKIDLHTERKITEEKARNLANDLNLRYFETSCLTREGIYNFMYDLADNNDGFFVNTRKDDEKLVINSQMFISNFNYISEFLDKVSGVRLISGKREIDVNSIMSIMNDIILKYQKINKVLRKH